MSSAWSASFKAATWAASWFFFKTLAAAKISFFNLTFAGTFDSNAFGSWVFVPHLTSNDGLAFMVAVDNLAGVIARVDATEAFRKIFTFISWTSAV